MKRIDVLSLGAGTQSSAMLLMAAHGDLPKPDYVIFADTGWEPKIVYDWLEKLQNYVKSYGIEIITTSAGNIREDVLRNHPIGKRVASMPFYTKDKDGKKGIVMRQCTMEYKIAPINKKVRELLGYKPRQKVRETVHMWRGISTDEIVRVKPSKIKWIVHEHPLVDKGMDRQDCIQYVLEKMGELPPKSSCIGCPFHNDEMWLWIKNNFPSEWREAVEFDKAIRKSPRYKSELYLHKSCVPLDEVDFNDDQMTIDDFLNECEGMCGV
ncbi:phosphoadenosine phosphosulfate reductase [Geobacillus phage vB_GthS_PK5.1]|nr:phosphoadenosine phosphosulfate reductase [Geobacillus phage vB_GthS_PK5.1]